METAYREWEKKRRDTAQRNTVHHSRNKSTLGPRERRRLIQLVVCVVLFFVVFIGKGIFPQGLKQLQEKVLPTIRSDTDFKEVFSDLGHAISAGEPVMDTLGGLWVDVFGGGTVLASSPNIAAFPLYTSELTYLSSTPAMGVRHLVGLPPIEEVPAPVVLPSKTITISPRPSVAPTPAPQIPAVEHIEYNGPALPENTSMDKYNLGFNTTTPAMGRLTSTFGWREHPVQGGEKFHNGVDLAVNNGTPVLAFADGVVDYIGDDPGVYGQYLQIRHANGITSFYAHCSKLLVQQGDAVKMGQTVAESGDTGNVTGPHLHFEVKRNGVRLNPIYYIKTF